MTRVFIFGLDAASPTLIKQWRKDLPTLNRLINEGAWGPLKSTIPPFTSPAWACMATGKNPARVGIFGLRQRQAKSYHFVSPSSYDRRAPALWDLVSDVGGNVIVFNVPDTYPPQPVNGVMISGHPAPVDEGATITYPEDLRQQLDQLTGGYLVGPNVGFDDDSRSREFSTWQTVLSRQHAALEHLMETTSWQLCFTASLAVDGISHHFWKYLDPQHPEYDSDLASQYGDTIRHIYEAEDRRLASIVTRLTDDDLLLVVSDHGSAPCYHHVAVNLWLIDNGFLVLNDPLSTASRRRLGPIANLVFKVYRHSTWIRKLTRPFRQSKLRDAVVQAQFAHNTKGRVPFDALSINWAETTAYYLGDDRLYLNVAGREPQGVVQPGEDYEIKRTKLRQALMAATDPVSGKPLFAKIYSREEIYDGPYLHQAPDLILVPGDIHWNLGGAVGNKTVDQPIVSGKHHPQGVYIAWGKEVQPGQEQPADIYDIAPTALHVMGLPVPEDCDGQVRLEWFQVKGSIAQRPITTTKVAEREVKSHQWSEEEAAQIQARLRDLGYLD